MYYLIEIRQLLRLDLNFKTMFKTKFKTVFKIVFKTVFKPLFKTVFEKKRWLIKNMSFLKITDPKKRDFS